MRRHKQTDPIYGRRLLQQATAWLVNLPPKERRRVMYEALKKLRAKESP